MTTDRNKIKCAHCENMIDVENAEYKMDISANYICEECADKAVVITYEQLRTGDHYFHVEKDGEELVTGFYKDSKEQARQRAIEMARKLYGDDVVIIEE